MDVVTESVIDVYQRRDEIRGLKMVHEAEYLRFFQARFEPVFSQDHMIEAARNVESGLARHPCRNRVSMIAQRLA